MTDPLGGTVYTDALADGRTLVTTSYVPGYVAMILFAAGLGIAFVWLGRGLRRLRSK